MREIMLTQGKFALVDDEDFEELSKYKWHVHASKRSRTHYAARTERLLDGTRRRISMHTQITGNPSGETDHADGDGLNNTRGNLRHATSSENALNKGKKSGSYSSMFKGVSWHTRSGDWIAQATFDGRQRWLGSFGSEIAAAIAYDQVSRKHHKGFSVLNFPYGAG